MTAEMLNSCRIDIPRLREAEDCTGGATAVKEARWRMEADAAAKAATAALR